MVVVHDTEINRRVLRCGKGFTKVPRQIRNHRHSNHQTIDSMNSHTNQLLTPFENAIVRLHRRYLMGDNYRAAARLVIRAKLQFKFTLVRALQQQLDTFTPEPRCVVCKCNNTRTNNETCHDHE